VGKDPQNPNAPNPAILTRDVWADIQIHLVSDSAPGKSDGEIHAWVDGRKSHEYLQASLLRLGADRVQDVLQWNPTFGGGDNDSVDEDQFQFIDHIYLSGGDRPAAPPVDPGPGPNPALHPNEPAGFVPMMNLDGSKLIAGWGDDNWTRDAVIVDDPDNPTGSGKAIKLTHRAGGGGPAAKLDRFRALSAANGGTGYTGNGVRRQYWSYRRVVPVGQNACCGVGNGHKMAYFGMSPESKQGGGANEFFISLCVNTGWQIQLGGGGTSVDKFTNLFYPPSPGKEWHLELLRDAGDKGKKNGTLRIWVNGTEVPGSPWTGLTWDDPTRPGNLFDGMELYHTQHAPDAAHSWLEREWYVSWK
jgi:hypothetical protein